MTPATPISATV